MKSLEQKLAESEAKLENLSNTKLVVDDRSVSVSLKPKADNVCIPPFKRNHKEKAYFTKLDKGKGSDVDIEVSKLVSKPIARVQNKSIFMPTYRLCGVVRHIKPNCSLLRQNQTLRLDLLLGILMFLNLFMFVTFVVCLVIFILTVIN